MTFCIVTFNIVQCIKDNLVSVIIIAGEIICYMI